MATITTHHSYPDLLQTGGRLARTDWNSDNVGRAIAGTIRGQRDAAVLRVTVDGVTVARGLSPAGLGPLV